MDLPQIFGSIIMGTAMAVMGIKIIKALIDDLNDDWRNK